MPNLFVLGAAKCGTTALVDYLYQHRDVYSGHEKECHFFNDDEAYILGLKKYIAEFFPNSSSYKIRLDGTPAYLRGNDKIISRIKSSYIETEHLKFIIMVRNPLDRAYSHYRHMCRISLESLSFSEGIKQEKIRLEKKYRGSSWWGYYHDSKFTEQIDDWVQAFGRRSVLILNQKDLLKNPQEVLNLVCDFLSIDNFVIQEINSNSESMPKLKLLNILVNRNFFGRSIIKHIFGKFTSRNLRVKINRMNQKVVSRDTKEKLKDEAFSQLDNETIQMFEYQKELLKERYGISLE